MATKKATTTKKAATKKAPAKKAPEKKAKPEVKMMTIANICREHEVCPKKGRAKLRKQGWSAQGKTYPSIEFGSAKYEEVVEIITG